MVFVRSAILSDAPAIARIHVATWQCAYEGQVPEKYLNSLSVAERTKGWEEIISSNEPGLHILVAEVAGEVVGWCTGGKCGDEDADATTGELHGIYVAPESIGHGAGSALMQTMKELLKADGFTQATLWVLITNVKTREFYEKKGWRVEGATKSVPKEDFFLDQIRYVTAL